MKNLFILFVLLLCSNSVLADIPLIPEHLTNPNYKQPPVNCEKAMKDANPFIPATIPDECMPKKQEQSIIEPVEHIQPKTKFGKFLNTLLEE